MSEKEINIIFRLEGGKADEGLLDIYDAANTIYGLARAINLVSHSFANDEHVRKKNQSADGAKAFIHPSKKGCFEEQIEVHFDAKSVAKIGSSVIVNAFWDYLTWTWSYAIGEEYSPETPYVRRIAEREATKKDIFIYEMSDALESPMQLMHKAIRRDSSVVAYLNRPRVGDVLKLNDASLDYVTVREEQTDTKYIIGNVTRFNVISPMGFGRIFSNEEGHVVSFELENPDDQRVRGFAINSMKEHNDGKDGKVHLKVSKIVSAQGVVKRYIVHDILPINLDDE